MVSNLSLYRVWCVCYDPINPASFSDGLKKRGRGMISADSYDLARKKRFRGLDASGNNNTEDGANAGVPAADVPKYTQRQVDYFEQVKLAETARIKAEYEQYIMKKDVEFQQLRQEVGLAYPTMREALDI